MHNIIIRPIISERSMKDANEGKFTFIVRQTATKKEIKEAVERLFAVNVLSVATSTMKGKTKRNGTRRVEIVEKPEKKGIVKLKQGQKIDAFELGA